MAGDGDGLLLLTLERAVVMIAGCPSTTEDMLRRVACKDREGTVGTGNERALLRYGFSDKTSSGQ